MDKKRKMNQVALLGAAGYDYDYDCHLIDCRSHGGFSGSPCFVELMFVQGMDAPNDVIGAPLYRALMCGMFTKHYDDSDDPQANPDAAVSRLGVGIMVRGEDIKKALLSEEMKEDRVRREAENGERLAKAPKVGPSAARAQPVPTSLESNESDSITATTDLLKNLLRAPNDEMPDDQS